MFIKHSGMGFLDFFKPKQIQSKKLFAQIKNDLSRVEYNSDTKKNFYLFVEQINLLVENEQIFRNLFYSNNNAQKIILAIIDYSNSDVVQKARSMYKALKFEKSFCNSFILERKAIYMEWLNFLENELN
ncbi:MAG: hypothetical protein ACMXX7_00915 [Candidatus Woesearchaeota archaeon]